MFRTLFAQAKTLLAKWGAVEKGGVWSFVAGTPGKAAKIAELEKMGKPPAAKRRLQAADSEPEGESSEEKEPQKKKIRRSRRR